MYSVHCTLHVLHQEDAGGSCSCRSSSHIGLTGVFGYHRSYHGYQAGFLSLAYQAAAQNIQLCVFVQISFANMIEGKNICRDVDTLLMIALR